MLHKYKERALHIAGQDRLKYRKAHGHIDMAKRMIYAVEADVEMRKVEEHHQEFLEKKHE